MTTQPHTPSGSAADGTQTFAGLGAGLGFFQEWMKAAGASIPGMNTQSPAAMPGMPAWSVPTLDPEELDKRIQELKTVQFWLEQNSRMIAMTIQGMEVQKMTLSTLKGMNVSMDALRETLTAKTPSSTTDTPRPATKEEADESPAPPNDLINPMQWWDTLTQQFSQLASQASQTAQTVGQTVEATMQDMVAKAQAAAPTDRTSEPVQKPGKSNATSAASKSTTRKRPSRAETAVKSAKKS